MNSSPNPTHARRKKYHPDLEEMYGPGDTVIYCRRHRGRTYKILATVTRAYTAFTKCVEHGYHIRSGNGGEMHADHSELRPGNAVDLLAASL